MKQKTLNLTLGVVAFGLLGAILLLQKRDEDKAKAEADGGAPLTTLAADAVTQIVIHHEGAADIRLERKDAKAAWQLTSPVQTAADPVQVGQLLGIAASPARTRLDVAGIARKDFGLEPPQSTLTLGDTQLAFGDIEPIRYLRYVEVDAGKPGDTLALIRDPEAALLDADWTDLAAKSLVPEGAELQHIELPGLKLDKVAGAWALTPADPAATADALQTFAEGWARAAAIRTEAPEAPPADAAKTAPEPLVLGFADGRTRRFAIVEREPQLVLDDPQLGLRYRLPPEASAKLLALPKPPAPAAVPTSPAPAAGKDADTKKPDAAEAAPK